MRILILGAGKMGSFFTDVLSFDHDVAVYDIKPQNLRFMYNCLRFTSLDEIKEFRPELVINAATVKYTLDAFRQVLPVIPQDCIISDIASVKTGLQEYEGEVPDPSLPYRKRLLRRGQGPRHGGVFPYSPPNPDSRTKVKPALPCQCGDRA